GVRSVIPGGIHEFAHFTFTFKVFSVLRNLVDFHVGDTVLKRGKNTFYFLLCFRTGLSGVRVKKSAPVQDAFNSIFKVNYLFIIFLASILKVAWGTARRRALSISFPVTLQIPYVLFSIRIIAFSR